MRNSKIIRIRNSKIIRIRNSKIITIRNSKIITIRNSKIITIRNSKISKDHKFKLPPISPAGAEHVDPPPDGRGGGSGETGLYQSGRLQVFPHDGGHPTGMMSPLMCRHCNVQ